MFTWISDLIKLIKLAFTPIKSTNLTKGEKSRQRRYMRLSNSLKFWSWIIMNKFLIFILIPLSLFGDKFIVTIENDSLMGAGDNDYTHGTCFEYFRNNWHYKLGQNMYAPSDLTRVDHIVGDRPYAGIIYGGVGYDILNDGESPWTHYLELDFGMIGPEAKCKETQKFIHKLLNCRDPKGWNNQLHSELVLNAQWWTKYNYYLNDWIALVPSAGIFFGNIQDSVEIGCDLKIGYNLKNSIGNGILLSSSNSWKENLSCYLLFGVFERYYLYNHFLQGSMFNHKDDELAVDINRFTTDGRVGIVFEYSRFYITYYAIFRTYEFKGQQNAPNYGGLSIGWSF